MFHLLGFMKMLKVICTRKSVLDILDVAGLKARTCIFFQGTLKGKKRQRHLSPWQDEPCNSPQEMLRFLAAYQACEGFSKQDNTCYINVNNVQACSDCFPCGRTVNVSRNMSEGTWSVTFFIVPDLMGPSRTIHPCSLQPVKPAPNSGFRKVREVQEVSSLRAAFKSCEEKCLEVQSEHLSIPVRVLELTSCIDSEPDAPFVNQREPNKRNFTFFAC